jgi:phosphoserine phosphatase
MTVEQLAKMVMQFSGYVGGYQARPAWFTDDVAWKQWVKLSEAARNLYEDQTKQTAQPNSTSTAATGAPCTIHMLEHGHRHGTDFVLFTGGDDLSAETIAARLGLDYEADREDEYLDTRDYFPEQIRNVDEIADPTPEQNV